MGFLSKIFKTESSSKNKQRIPISYTPMGKSAPSIDAMPTKKTNEVLTKKANAAPIEDYIVIDLETTGLSKFEDSIIEIGMVRYSVDSQTKTFSTYINPEKPIPKRITEISGITDGDVLNAPVITEVLADILEFIGTTPLVAHNAEFDIGFLCEALRRKGIPFTFDYVDTLELARKAFPAAPNHKLNTLVEYLSIEGAASQEHRALSDALLTNELFLRCSKLCKINIQSQDVTLPPQLSEIEMQIAVWAKETLLKHGKDITFLAFEPRSKYFEISYYYKILDIKLGKNLTYVLVNAEYLHLADLQVAPGSKDESPGMRYSFHSVSELADIEPILIAAYDQAYKIFSMAKSHLSDKNWAHYFEKATQI